MGASALTAEPDTSFAGKVAVVTGAATGIGEAVGRRLAALGASAALLDLDGPGAEKVAADLAEGGADAIGLAVDVRDSASIDAAIDRVEAELGAVDVLVNVAGVLRVGDIVDLSDEDWDTVLGVNATGVFKVSRAVARRMAARGGGAVVTVASNAAEVPRKRMGAYAASKAAAIQFTRCLGLELAGSGVRCNTVSPGSTDTQMLRSLWRPGEGPEAAIEGSLADHRTGIPLGKLATGEDVADAVAFLASDRASHITLQDLTVDGGAAL